MPYNIYKLHTLARALLVLLVVTMTCCPAEAITSQELQQKVALARDTIENEIVLTRQQIRLMLQQGKTEAQVEQYAQQRALAIHERAAQLARQIDQDVQALRQGVLKTCYEAICDPDVPANSEGVTGDYYGSTAPRRLINGNCPGRSVHGILVRGGRHVVQGAYDTPAEAWASLALPLTTANCTRQ